MTDTALETKRMLRAKIMARSGEERLVMGAQMFEAARAMVQASLQSGLPREEWRRQFFGRVYGETLPEGAT